MNVHDCVPVGGPAKEAQKQDTIAEAAASSLSGHVSFCCFLCCSVDFERSCGIVVPVESLSQRFFAIHARLVAAEVALSQWWRHLCRTEKAVANRIRAEYGGTQATCPVCRACGRGCWVWGVCVYLCVCVCVRVGMCVSLCVMCVGVGAWVSLCA